MLHGRCGDTCLDVDIATPYPALGAIFCLYVEESMCLFWLDDFKLCSDL